MKKNTVYLFFALFFCFSCSNSRKKNVSDYKYKIKTDSATITWFAYKTNEKVPVQGTFNTITINTKLSEAPLTELLEESTFSIPFSTVNTWLPERDSLVINFFFQKSFRKYN